MNNIKTILTSSISAFFFLLTINTFSQKNINVILLVNDNKKTLYDLENLSNLIYLDNSNIKLNQFTIYHFSGKNEKNIVWSNNKKSVEYKHIYKNCNSEICDPIKLLISDKKTTISKLFIYDSNLSCDISYSVDAVEKMPNQNESTISRILKEQIALNKKTKDIITLFYYISEEQTSINPTVLFQKDTFELKKGESLQLHPTYSGEVKKIEWKPVDGLSCGDCKDPFISPSKSVSYSIKVTDSLQCKTQTKDVFIEVKNSCNCFSNLKPIRDVFGVIPISKYKTADLADWQISANQSGGKIFDLVTEPNCGSKFKLLIKDDFGKTIFEDVYDRSDVDFRSLLDYHKKFKDKFVFRMDLNSIYNSLDYKNKCFIQIYSYDDENNECSPYKSPSINFSKCE